MHDNESRKGYFFSAINSEPPIEDKEEDSQNAHKEEKKNEQPNK